MTFPSAAVRAETPRGWEEPESGPGATTWVSPDTGRDFPGIFNQPVELPHPRRRKDD